MNEDHDRQLAASGEPLPGTLTDFTLEELVPGLNAQGYGHTDDGRRFTFAVIRRTLTVEIFARHSRAIVPDVSERDVIAERDIAELDLDDERSIAAAVRDVVTHAQTRS